MAKGFFRVIFVAGFSASGALSDDEPISNDAGNLPLPGVSSTNSSARVCWISFSDFSFFLSWAGAAQASSRADRARVDGSRKRMAGSPAAGAKDIPILRRGQVQARVAVGASGAT